MPINRHCERGWRRTRSNASGCRFGAAAGIAQQHDRRNEQPAADDHEDRAARIADEVVRIRVARLNSGNELRQFRQQGGRRDLAGARGETGYRHVGVLRRGGADRHRDHVRGAQAEFLLGEAQHVRRVVLQKQHVAFGALGGEPGGLAVGQRHRVTLALGLVLQPWGQEQARREDGSAGQGHQPEKQCFQAGRAGQLSHPGTAAAGGAPVPLRRPLRWSLSGARTARRTRRRRPAPPRCGGGGCTWRSGRCATRCRS